MSKKNKKKIQKNRQSKAMKRRSKKKGTAMPPRTPEVDSPLGLPGQIPSHMRGDAEKMMMFVEPLIEASGAASLNEIQKLLPLVQGFVKAFSTQDLEARSAMLNNVKIAYERFSWASQDFDSFAEALLKRHIYHFPDQHDPAERNRYTPEELQAVIGDSAAMPSELSQAFPDSDTSLMPTETKALSGLTPASPEISEISEISETPPPSEKTNA